MSKSVALRDSAMWARAMRELPAFLDGDGLAKYFPACATGSETLTSYLLSVSHEGAGRPWATITSLAAIPLKEPLSTGYKITKTVTPLERKDPSRWSRGDLLRVRLDKQSQADRRAAERRRRGRAVSWCLGYSREFTAGVWVGNFSGEPMWNVSGLSGAAPAWAEIMSVLHRRASGRAPGPPRASPCSGTATQGPAPGARSGSSAAPSPRRRLPKPSSRPPPSLPGAPRGSPTRPGTC